jgi:hypothetical protein
VPPGAGCTLKHHSHWIHIMEDMKWFSSIWWGIFAGNTINFGLDLLHTCQTVTITTVKNTVWGDTDVPPGAGCTLKHH